MFITICEWAMIAVAAWLVAYGLNSIRKKKKQVVEQKPMIATSAVDHDKLEVGLKKYCRIQAMFHEVDVSNSREFQKMFNGFYRVRRNTEWQGHFYGIMERSKTEEMDFDKALRLMHEATGNIEASFCSKLIASRYPDRPVIDRFVLENLGMALPKQNAADRLGKTVKVYELLISRYADMLGDPVRIQAVKELRARFPLANEVRDVKALDLILWQTR